MCLSLMINGQAVRSLVELYPKRDWRGKVPRMQVAKEGRDSSVWCGGGVRE